MITNYFSLMDYFNEHASNFFQKVPDGDQKQFDCKMVDLPQDMMVEISYYLAPEDLTRLARTCKAWNQILKKDVVWKKQAERLDVSLTSDLGLTIEHQVRERLQHFSKIIKIFGGCENFAKIPVLRLGSRLKFGYAGSITVSQVSAPIMRGEAVDVFSCVKFPFITLRYKNLRNHSNGKLLVDYIFRDMSLGRFVCWSMGLGREVSEGLVWGGSLKTDYLKRLINHEPVGEVLFGQEQEQRNMDVELA